MAALLDLAGLQANRDAEVRRGRAVVAERIDDLAEKILTWAFRAHRARARLARDDAEAGHAVERWCIRRLRGDVRRVVGKVPDSVKADAVGLAEGAFAARLRMLETEL
jgi:hypothetical protein